LWAKDDKTLFLLSFSMMRKKVNKERITFAIYPQANFPTPFCLVLVEIV